MSFIEQFLESSKMSNMRFNFSLIVCAAVLLFVAMTVYIIVFSIKGIEITHWAEMGIFLGGVTTSIWAMASEKRKQKGLEKNEDTNKHS